MTHFHVTNGLRGIDILEPTEEGAEETRHQLGASLVGLGPTPNSVAWEDHDTDPEARWAVRPGVIRVRIDVISCTESCEVAS